MGKNNVTTSEQSPASPVKKFKSFKNFNNTNRNTTNESTSIANMVERFVQSISHINDSGTFDSSFEVKQIIASPQRIRHRCVTELDRESIMQFVRDYEARQANTTTATKDSTACYKNFISSTTMEQQPAHNYENIAITPLNSPKLMPAPEQPPPSPSPAPATPTSVANASEDTTSLLQRSQPERSSYRTACKVLQFFSAKKKSKSQKASTTASSTSIGDSSRCSSVATSPVSLRAHLGCRPLQQRSNSDAEDAEEADDGISTASSSNFTHTSTGSIYSRNCSPDSSFEMHPPLLPSFKVTPPHIQKSSSCRNPAYEFARFLRGSFHAKRASVTTLRRSISDPDNTDKQLEDLNTKQPAQKKKSSKVLTDATNLKHSDVIRVSHF